MPKTIVRRLLMPACLAACAWPAAAFDSQIVRAKLDAAMVRPPVAFAATVGGTVQSDRDKRAKDERDGAFLLFATCDGRFNALRTTQQKQIRRAEMISIGGGLIGVLGAVATCPHCAALAAGIAGLANPLQQTFRDNYDAPQNTQDILDKLWVRIDSDIKEYRQLPVADPSDAVTFDVNLQKRLDALLSITASCSYYSATLQQTAPQGK